MSSKYLFITLLFLAIIFGCAKALGPGYVFQSGEMALARAADTTDDKTRQKETEKATSLFLQIINEGEAGSKWVNKAHFQVAEVYKSQFKWGGQQVNHTCFRRLKSCQIRMLSL